MLVHVVIESEAKHRIRELAETDRLAGGARAVAVVNKHGYFIASGGEFEEHEYLALRALAKHGFSAARQMRGLLAGDVLNTVLDEKAGSKLCVAVARRADCS